jgi:hypothetical protein
MVSDAVVVGRGAIGIARRVGPTAWTVLTVLAVDADSTGGAPAARASVRSLANRLGLNKDTVARALARLWEAGLIVATTSRFEPSVYVLTVPVDVITFMLDAPPHDARRERHSAYPSPVEQLALLEAD